MAEHAYITVDVFTDQGKGGNPLAVVTDARGLTAESMQALAARFGHSETVFVLPPDNPQHHAKLRIFTPRREVPFAGHPNVGAGFVLAQQDADPPEHYTFEEAAGLVRVHLIHAEHGGVSGARIAAPHSLQLGIQIPTEIVAACIGLHPHEIRSESHPPIVASVGLKFVIAELSGAGALARAAPDVAAIARAAAQFPDAGDDFLLHVYARIEGDATRLVARMFGPLAGVTEDPATGSANATLAALLTSLAPGADVALHYDIAQGAGTGRPSRILAGARKTAEGPITATVAGECVERARGTVTA